MLSRQPAAPVATQMVAMLSTGIASAERIAAPPQRALPIATVAQSALPHAHDAESVFEWQQRRWANDEVRAVQRKLRTELSRATARRRFSGVVRQWRVGDDVWLNWAAAGVLSKQSARFSWSGPWRIVKFDDRSQAATLALVVLQSATASESTEAAAAAVAASAAVSAAAVSTTAVARQQVPPPLPARSIVTSLVTVAHARRLRPFGAPAPIINVADAGPIQMRVVPGLFSLSMPPPVTLDSLPAALRVRVAAAWVEAAAVAARQAAREAAPDRVGRRVAAAAAAPIAARRRGAGGVQSEESGAGGEFNDIAVQAGSGARASESGSSRGARVQRQRRDGDAGE